MRPAFLGKTKGQRQAGLSMIEALLALTISTIFLVEIFSLVSSIREIAIDIGLTGEATKIAMDNLRHLDSMLKNNFMATSSPSIEAPLPFMAGTQISDITPCRRSAMSSVSWSKMFSKSTAKVLVSRLIGSMEMLQKLGNDCGGNDFLSKITTSSPFAISSTEFQFDVSLTGVDVYRSYSFIPAISENPEAPDLFVIDTNENPQIVSFLDIGHGLNNLDAANSFIFAAQNSSTSQLAVIDIHDPRQPFLVTSSTLPAVTGSRPQGWSIYYFDQKVYIGTRRTAGHEFHVYDVSNPAHPVWLGSREVNHNINSITVRSTTAYLATSGNIRDLIVLDVSDPRNITQKAVLDLPGSEDGKSLFVVGNTLYLGRFKTSNNSPNHDFYALDISDVPLGGNISLLGFYNVRADVNALRVFGPYAFLATSDPLREFVVLDVSSSTSIFSPKSLDFSSKATGLDYENASLVISTFNLPLIYQTQLSP